MLSYCSRLCLDTMSVQRLLCSDSWAICTENVRCPTVISSSAIEPDDVIVLLTAPTGVAAFNINGMTLAFLLGGGKYTGFQPLSHDRLNTLRSKLSKLTLVIINEVSMVGSNMLLEIHKRLQQIKCVSDDYLAQ